MMKVNQIDFEKKTVWLEADNGDHENRHTLTREFKDVILMQSTGLKDKNGVEIFEGDVVNIHWFYTDYDPETLGAIENEATAEKVVITKEFGNLGFWWNSGDDWVDLATLALTVQLHEESFELLGNVHENPELLEVK
ncbi:YopX family protein [Enterococcus faecalis]|nr:YopX family protein [Enterococcus faecalis]